MKKKYLTLLTAILPLVFFSSCRTDDLLADDNQEDLEEIIDVSDYADWTEATHGSITEPNYSVVFNQNEVLRFDITIDSEDWASMQADLSANLSSGIGGFGGPPPGMGGGGGGANTSSNYDPVWVPCSVKFNDIEWYHVGIRFKGNSSLQSAYQSGNNKLSFKLDFDEFEDDYPGIKNQRFYGFKQLNLNNNFGDASLMREKIGADLFREFGLVASQTAFCIVYVDNGTGPQYYGVYALVEEVDDTTIKNQFTQSNGNLYKPDGSAATFANGSFNTDQLYLKSNKDSADYSDAETLYNVLNSSERTSNPEVWQQNLESVFYVNGFLKWLAANTVIQNWDTYGIMTHNYYLYNNPENGLMTWIPWDNNEAFQEGKQGGALSLSLSEVGPNWPFISYLIEQDNYKQTYHNYLQKFIDEVFIPSKMINTYSEYYQMLKDYAYSEESGYTYLQTSSDFDAAVETLKTHVQSRNSAVESYLNNF